MKTTFKAKILAEVNDTPEVLKGGISIASVIAKLARGEMSIELPKFFDEPTIILKEHSKNK